MDGFTYGGSDGATLGGDDGAAYGDLSRTEHASDGFAYGTVNGARYGTEDGGTWSVINREWIVGGTEIRNAIEETATWEDLTLLFRVPAQVVLGALRSFKVDENQVETLATDDGGFTSVDRSGGSNTVELIPPKKRTPLRQRGDYHVTGYEEDMVTQELDEWDVDLEFVRTGHRDETVSINETASGDEWTITTRHGTIATDRVSADVLGTGADGVERFELTLTLEMDQAHAFEAAVPRVDGARVRVIPDGSNVAVDETSDDAATVTLTVPDGGEIDDDDYVVFRWQSTRLNDHVERYEVEIAREG